MGLCARAWRLGWGSVEYRGEDLKLDIGQISMASLNSSLTAALLAAELWIARAGRDF